MAFHSFVKDCSSTRSFCIQLESFSVAVSPALVAFGLVIIALSTSLDRPRHPQTSTQTTATKDAIDTCNLERCSPVRFASTFLFEKSPIQQTMARRLHHTHHASHPQARDALAMPPSKASDFVEMVERRISGLGSLVKRQSSAASSSSSCSSSDSSGTCQKPSTSNNISLPVALGVM